MRFFILDYEYPEGEDGQHYMVDDGMDFDGVDSWALGRPFDQAPPNPIVITMSQSDPEWNGPRPPPMIDEYMCLMSEQIVDALKSIPVGNIDIYPAVLKDEEAGLEWRYYGVNIIGLVQSADLEKSKWLNLDGPARHDTVFTKTVVDPAKTMGLDMFRLAEDTGTIVISERVQRVLVGIPFVVLRPVN